MIKRIVLFLVAAFVLLLIILLYNTYTFHSKQLAIKSSPPPELTEFSIQHFQKAIQFKTVSFEDSAKFDSASFNSFHRFLKSTYPLFHQKTKLELVAGYSLLYYWEGKNPDLKPVILMAHQDVVPVEEATGNLWTIDPFAGVVKNDSIWGRGTTDDKINLIGILEASEKLLQKNFQPERSLYFAFGHDEEKGGSGAKAIATLLESRNITTDLVLDEGGIITRKEIPGMTLPVALIGTSEKGYLSLEISVEKSGGHSSRPEPETSIDILAKAIVNLREHPFPASFSASTEAFLDHVGPEMPFFEKVIFANRWLFERLIISMYEKKSAGNAFVRTTIVPTIFQAGVKDNVIPSVAKAIVNFRLLPGDNIQGVMERVKEIIADDRVKVIPTKGFMGEPTEVTDENSFAYKKVDESVKRSFENTITTPFMMIGGTDSRHFGKVSRGIIKFSPMTDPIGYHGINERVSLESYRSTLWFYETLIKDL